MAGEKHKRDWEELSKLDPYWAVLSGIINSLLRARNRVSSTVADVKILKNGRLENSRLTTLWALFMRRSPANETTVASRCILTQMGFGIAAITFAYYHVNFIVPHVLR